VTATRTERRLPRLGWVGIGLVGAFVALGLLGPVIAGYDPRALSAESLRGPSRSHLLGTNQLGQDLASQMLYGARTSLLMAAVTAAATLVLATAVGVTAGWAGRTVDVALMRFVDIMLATPRLPLLIVIGAYFGDDMATVALAMAAVFWPGPARMIRGQVRSLRERTHVRAAASFGAGRAYLIRHHVLPDVSLILAASLVSTAGRAVLFESGLAFLGLGDPFRTSWGSMLRESRTVVGLFYSDIWMWWILPPIVAMVLVLLGLTFISMALEERVNPRLARHAHRRPVLR
jgi:peptide/nickel transport system permease protein